MMDIEDIKLKKYFNDIVKELVEISTNGDMYISERISELEKIIKNKYKEFTFNSLSAKVDNKTDNLMLVSFIVNDKSFVLEIQRDETESDS